MKAKPLANFARWSKWDAFRDGRPLVLNSREVGRLYREIDAGWRFFWAQRVKKGVQP